MDQGNVFTEETLPHDSNMELLDLVGSSASRWMHDTVIDKIKLRLMSGLNEAISDNGKTCMKKRYISFDYTLCTCRYP